MIMNRCMKRKNYFLIAFLLFSFPGAFAQTKDNAELQKMYTDDQNSRKAGNIDWTLLSVQDSLREIRVYELIKEGKIHTARDYYYSALIFQHGHDTLASAMAVMQMKKAIELDSTINKWLLAAAIDRDLMRRDKPQIYGTQYVKMGRHGKWERYKIDTTQVTDQERRYYHVETLAEQRAKEHDMNLLPVSDYYSQSGSIDKTIQFIKDERKKGNASAYNLSEEEINSFAYELMSANKDQEALKIFKLNTELYPNGYNTFDSYGECLLKLHQKKEALKAYKKSLDLNPKNENARKILSEHQ
jgi:tetratricopeptide (TPR) repeat protein